jgi:ATP-binding cassette, subfamily C, bacterial CydCD
VITAALAVAEAWLLATAVNAAFVEHANAAALGTTLVLLGAVLAARAAVAWGQEWAARLCSAAVKSRLRMLVLRRAAKLSASRVSPTPSGEIVALTTRGLDALDSYFARYVPQLALALIVPLAVIGCLAAVDLLAALTVLVTVPLIPFFMVLIGTYTERRRTRRWVALARLSHHFLDVVAGLPTLRVYGQGRAQLGRLERVTDDYRRESMGTLRVAFLSAFALELAATISVALVALGVGLRLVDGLTDLRTGLFAIILAPEAYLPLRALGASFHASEEGLAAADAAFRIIEAGPEPAGRGEVAGGGGASRAAAAISDPAVITDPAAAAPVTPPAVAAEWPRLPVPDLAGAEIRIEGLTVRQPGRALEAPWQASLALRPGEVLGVAGPSGSGKSSLIEALLGLRSAHAGRVLVVLPDGRTLDVADFDRADWHRHVAWVPQRPYFFPGTIADNARLAAPDATDDEVRAALTALDLGDLDPAAPLGEAGSGISSGQRRRIGVARALLRRAPILVLDEPTAGLDEASEAAALVAIRAAARRDGRAVLLVAHRPAALAVADRVVSVESREAGAA